MEIKQIKLDITKYEGRNDALAITSEATLKQAEQLKKSISKLEGLAESETKLEWEDIDDWNQRARVHGGWIVQTAVSVSHVMPSGGLEDGWDWRISTCFVPDPNGEWK